VRITPIDIRKQEFRRTLRGLDADEVETFLAMVADEMEHLIGETQQAKAEAKTLRERLSEYQQMEATMRETLVTVQRVAEEKRDAARREAEMILKEAEVRASQWIEEAHRSIREVKRELAKLRGMRDSYVARLRMLIQAQLDMLKMVETEEQTPDETLDLFEERLEALSRQAREKVAVAGESILPVAFEEIAEEEEIAGKKEIEVEMGTKEERREESEEEGPVPLGEDLER
jgi:cell division initiation protein